MLSERIKQIAKESREMGMNPPQNTYQHDLHHYACNEYKDLEQWEKIARSTADAIVNQKVYINPTDEIIGRIFYFNNKDIEEKSPDLDYLSEPESRIAEEFPEYEEFTKYHLTGDHYRGHMCWNYNDLLKLGTIAIKEQYEDAIARSSDIESINYYKAVIIAIEGLERWNDKHIVELEKLGMERQAELCRRSVRYPAKTFREALQTYWMQYLVVMTEFPAGGNGPGRLDYYLWPYLENDIKNNICTLEEAEELIKELFIRIDEKVTNGDGWVEAIVVGGCYSNGASAINPLTYIMIDAITELNITHPSIYVRVPENASDDFLDYCAKYLINGGNRAQLLSDKNIINALTKSGVSYRDAVDYYCGGCMEIAIQGMNCDYLFNGWTNIVKMVELSATGGLSLNDGKIVSGYKAKGLINCSSFEEFYLDFIEEAKRIITMYLKAQDIYSERAEKAYPSYFLSAMLEDSLKSGRSIHGGGARYHDYGQIPMGLPNASDYLFAIKKAVFDEKICTAEELLNALKTNFKDSEELRVKFKNIPKFGQENEEADSMMKRLCNDISKAYSSYTTRFGGRGKVVIMTFYWAPEAGGMLGATADGNYAGKSISQGVTPQSTSMTEGITAAINSCSYIPFDKFNGGASTMWDFDDSWVKEDIIKALFMTFFDYGGQIFQGNTTSLEELIEAQKNPEDFPNLIVRVGGFSARFTTLSKQVQDEIIQRIRHKK